MYDDDAWIKYPQHHNWFNKLFVAEQMGYNCGPSGLAPSVTDYYMVRPTYNLSGMGVGADMIKIDAGDPSKVPPGYFWCEFIGGIQYSATYEFTLGRWKPISCWEGHLAHQSFTKFVGWTRSTYAPEVPREFNVLSDVKRINVEFKGTKPIEVHLRDTPDPDYDDIVPVWNDSSFNMDIYLGRGYKYIESFDNANGFLETARLGFLVK
jgi:hypothetical protein